LDMWSLGCMLAGIVSRGVDEFFCEVEADFHLFPAFRFSERNRSSMDTITTTS
jgi:hypothetical protein